jgi:CheY-like chemotaxis protein
MLARMIGRCVPGAVISVVVSGAQAIEMLLRRPADVVLTDLRMPGMGGLQLTETIKTRWPATRVVPVTATAESDLRPGAQSVQADAHLVKPFSSAQMLAELLRGAVIAMPPAHGTFKQAQRVDQPIADQQLFDL